MTLQKVFWFIISKSAFHLIFVIVKEILFQYAYVSDFWWELSTMDARSDFTWFVDARVLFFWTVFEKVTLNTWPFSHKNDDCLWSKLAKIFSKCTWSIWITWDHTFLPSFDILVLWEDFVAWENKQLERFRNMFPGTVNTPIGNVLKKGCKWWIFCANNLRLWPGPISNAEKFREQNRICTLNWISYALLLVRETHQIGCISSRLKGKNSSINLPAENAPLAASNQQ